MEFKSFTKKREKGVFNGDLVREFLEGRVVPIPIELFNALQSSSLRRIGRELCALQYDLVTRRCIGREETGVPIYHELFEFGTSKGSANRAKRWLRDGGFISWGESYSNSKNKKKCKRYWAKQLPFGTHIRLEELSKKGNSPYAEKEVNCTYAREMLNLLRFNFQEIKDAVEVELAGEDQNEQLIWLQTYANRLVDLINRDGKVSRGRLGRRLFSPMTNLKKSYRRFFSFDREPMVNLDMGSAHPTLLANLSNDEKLLEDCLANRFYEKMPVFPLFGRDAAKDEYYEFAYAPVDDSKLSHKEMEKNYPIALNFVVEHKSSGYKKFSHFMQQKESDLWVDQIYGEIRRRKIRALTIHDSVFTGKSNEEEVRQIIEDVMERNGITMTLKAEEFF